MAKSVYRCILLDDELLALSLLRTLCESIPEIEVIKAFNQPELFLEQAPNLSFDFCISDIVMPGHTGLEIARKLEGKPVIFTTAHNEYAADAFDVEAIDFLRKPVQLDRLQRAVQKAIVHIELNRNQREWQTNTARGKMNFRPAEIVSLSANTIDRRDKLLLLSDGSTHTIKNKSFEQLITELEAISFLRISKSEIVNPRFLQGYHADLLISTLKENNGTQKVFSLSENYKKSVLEHFKNRG